MAFQHKVTSGQRQQMIAEAAYFRAERRGFSGGDAVRDWCEAEAEIDARLKRIEAEQLVARVEEVVAAAGKKIAAVRRKAARLTTEARSEWQKDVDKLAALRDALQPKLAEIREQGERAGQKVREQAEKIRAELAELVQRLEARTKH
jgi:predicted  nucleic acid-binding Zn-ribbon protein